MFRKLSYLVKLYIIIDIGKSTIEALYLKLQIGGRLKFAFCYNLYKGNNSENYI